jgi:predicted DNA-binding protein with PD1-like motif
MSRHRYIPTPTGYLMVLTQGDDVLGELALLAHAEDLPSASFTGIGFARKAVFGFFDFDRKVYQPKTFENVEIASLAGTIAWKDGKPSVHAHAVAADATFGAVGGHLLALDVGTGSMEVTVMRHDRKLLRATDASIGANILQLSAPE